VVPQELFMILDRLVHRSTKNENREIARYRKLLDEIDGDIMNLILKRMQISREIGAVKKENNIAVFQPFRYNETLQRFAEKGITDSMDVDAMKDIFETIHAESIRLQLRIVNDDK